MKIKHIRLREEEDIRNVKELLQIKRDWEVHLELDQTVVPGGWFSRKANSECSKLADSFPHVSWTAPSTPTPKVLVNRTSKFSHYKIFYFILFLLWRNLRVCLLSTWGLFGRLDGIR